MAPEGTEPQKEKRGNRMSDAIVIETVSKSFGRKKALQGLSLRIPQGMFGLLGRNGAGKTTLMRTIADRKSVV